MNEQRDIAPTRSDGKIRLSRGAFCFTKIHKNKSRKLKLLTCLSYDSSARKVE